MVCDGAVSVPWEAARQSAVVFRCRYMAYANVSGFQLYRDTVDNFGHLVGGGAERRGEPGETAQKAVGLRRVGDTVTVNLIGDDDERASLLRELKQRGHDFVGMAQRPVDFIGIQIREILEEENGVFKGLRAELRDVRRALERRVAAARATLLVLRDARGGVSVPRGGVHRRDVVKRPAKLGMQALRELLRIF